MYWFRVILANRIRFSNRKRNKNNRRYKYNNFRKLEGQKHTDIKLTHSLNELKRLTRVEPKHDYNKTKIVNFVSVSSCIGESCHIFSAIKGIKK